MSIKLSTSVCRNPATINTDGAESSALPRSPLFFSASHETPPVVIRKLRHRPRIARISRGSSELHRSYFIPIIASSRQIEGTFRERVSPHRNDAFTTVWTCSSFQLCFVITLKFFLSSYIAERFNAAKLRLYSKAVSFRKN